MPRPYSIPSRYRRRPYKDTPADRQRIFDIVWEWFVIRKHPRCHNGSSCMYRLTSDDGTKNACAVGIFIPSCAPVSMLQFIGDVSKLVDQYPSQMSRIFNAALIPFLSRLQEAHDIGGNLVSIEDNLRELAEDHNLTIPGERP